MTASNDTSRRSGPDPSTAPTGGDDSRGDTLRFRRSHVYSALIPLAFVVGLATGFLFWGRTPSPAAAPVAAEGTEAPTRLEVSVDDDPSLGPADAPITIIEFSDFNCPYCKKWHTEIYPQLMAAYPDQIRFVYRDFPITSEESLAAAQAANCAGEQDAYWQFHDSLLSGGLDLGRDAYTQYATRLGLNVEALLACLDSGKYNDEVEADARYAAGLGVSGTPTFFINGLPLVGAQPLSAFQSVIESELNS
jgi:protein-disulfide isomerase